MVHQGKLEADLSGKMVLRVCDASGKAKGGL